MAKKFYTKHGDTYLGLRLNADLTGSTVRVQVSPTGASTPLPDLPVTVTNNLKGEIRVTISGLAVGTYDLEVEQNQGGTITHYPNRGFDILVIGADLDA